MSDTEDSSKHSYSTGGTSGGGSSVASSNSDAAALNALADHGCVPVDGGEMLLAFKCTIIISQKPLAASPRSQLPPSHPCRCCRDNNEGLNDLLDSTRKLDEGVSFGPCMHACCCSCSKICVHAVQPPCMHHACTQRRTCTAQPPLINHGKPPNRPQVFATLLLLNKKRSQTDLCWVTLRVLFEFLQFFRVVFNTSFSAWSIDKSVWAFQAIRWVLIRWVWGACKDWRGHGLPCVMKMKGAVDPPSACLLACSSKALPKNTLLPLANDPPHAGAS
jgi:hypothetical protein